MLDGAPGPQLQDSVDGYAGEGANFYSHAVPLPRDPHVQSNFMSSATRYLCAGAYLDWRFANRVIRNLIGSHRSVAPSADIDLIPIIRHCLKARKLRLTKDIILTLTLLLGILLAFRTLVVALVLAALLALIPGTQPPHKSVKERVAEWSGDGAPLTIVFALYLAYSLLQIGGSLLVRSESLTIGFPAEPFPYFRLFYFCLIAFALGFFSYNRYRTLGVWLRPGAMAPKFGWSSRRVEDRLMFIDGAQRGNLMLYDENPFLGAAGKNLPGSGVGGREWGIEIDLTRVGSRMATVHEGIDPVEIHEALNRRLLQLNDPELRVNQRVTEISVGGHVVAEGRLPWRSPLIDQVRKIPYSQASGDAVTALIRTPQARLRHYQRVSISDGGQAVLALGRPVIDPVAQETVVSAFVHIAVAGHTFYLHFVSTFLPPIDDRYRTIDMLPVPGSRKFVTLVAIEAARTAFAELAGAPLRICQTLWGMWQDSMEYHEEASRELHFAYADLGAISSVRQLGTRDGARTFDQGLDATKYTRVIERVVLDTVLDFLTEKGVDTTVYQQQAQSVVNHGVMVTGNVQGSTVRVTRQ